MMQRNFDEAFSSYRKLSASLDSYETISDKFSVFKKLINELNDLERYCKVPGHRKTDADYETAHCSHR